MTTTPPAPQKPRRPWYTSPFCHVMRAKVILLAAEGLSNKQIGARLELPRQLVSKWRKRFFEQRVAGLQERPRRGRPAVFPPEIVMEINALACQLSRDLGLPFSRLTRDEIARKAVVRGITASISGTTVWRWLSQGAIRPWCYRSRIWPRDPIHAGWLNQAEIYFSILQRKALTPNDFDDLQQLEKTILDLYESIKRRRVLSQPLACIEAAGRDRAHRPLDYRAAYHKPRGIFDQLNEALRFGQGQTPV